jgi:hypothetical protein
LWVLSFGTNHLLWKSKSPLIKGERRRNDSGREAFRGCRDGWESRTDNPLALRDHVKSSQDFTFAPPFVKGEYFHRA